MRKKKQIILIHGGETWKKREDYIRYLETREISLERRESWSREYLEKQLSQEFRIIRPQMPLKEDAKYEDWKIWFERHLEFLDDDCILIGNSLGGIFLAKYLSENDFPRRIKATFLVCPPFDDSIPDEDLAGGFELGNDLSKLEKNSHMVKLMFSKDDEVVPPSQAKKYKEALKDAEIIMYDDKNGHFNIKEFPEIVEMIREIGDHE
ncbi:MAG: alpha/beta hydrolase [Candidatus Woesearchaeota archaeon]